MHGWTVVGQCSPSEPRRPVTRCSGTHIRAVQSMVVPNKSLAAWYHTCQLGCRAWPSISITGCFANARWAPKQTKTRDSPVMLKYWHSSLVIWGDDGPPKGKSIYQNRLYIKTQAKDNDLQWSGGFSSPKTGWIAINGIHWMMCGYPKLAWEKLIWWESRWVKIRVLRKTQGLIHHGGVRRGTTTCDQALGAQSCAQATPSVLEMLSHPCKT